MTDASRNNATWTKPLANIPLPQWGQVIYCHYNQNTKYSEVKNKLNLLTKSGFFLKLLSNFLMFLPSACRDAYGSCRPIGSSGFDAYVSGQLRQDCKCLSEGVGVTGVRYTCGDMANPFQCEGC